VVASACGFTGALGKALAAFMAVLDGYSLADLIGRPRDFRVLFGLEAMAPPD
jgi:Rrf2 family nitric oxide-sensitive transcriptional repressor